MPRYFADGDRVMDLETRLVYCMVTQQGYTEADAKKNPYGAGSERRSDMEALVAYVTSESRGIKMNVALNHPKEREAFELGGKMFVFRGRTLISRALPAMARTASGYGCGTTPTSTVEGAQRRIRPGPPIACPRRNALVRVKATVCFRQQQAG
jgi:hypothetical protein